MNGSDRIVFPEFEYVITFEINHVVTYTQYDLFKNQSGQYVTVATDLENNHKTVVFYRNYKHLASVFSTDFTEIEMLIWR